MKNLWQLVTRGFLIIGLLSVFSAVATPQITQAACKTSFLTLPAWYDGLTGPEPDCQIVAPKEKGGFTPFIWTVVLNVLDAFLRVVAYVSVAFLTEGKINFL